MHIHGYSVHGERANGVTLYVVYLYRGVKVIKAPWWWIRFTLDAAHRKGRREMLKADARFTS